MRVLVIGGSGFIGSAIVEELLQDPSNEVHVLDREVHENRERVIYHVADVKEGRLGAAALLPWDYVVNLAGTLGTSEMFDDLSSLVDNIQGALTVLAQIKSGTTLYPIIPEGWMNPYTISKISARLIHEMYARYLNRKSIMVRLFNVYGPRQRWTPVRKVVPQLIMQALKDEPITVYGSGEQPMDLTYCGDAARAFASLMKSPPGGNYQIVEVGTGVKTSVNQCTQDIIECIGSKSKIVHVPMRIGEDPDTPHVCTNVYPLEGGYVRWPSKLKEVVDWYNDRFVHRPI